MKKINGFTLVELLATLIILSLMLIIAIPLVTSVLNTNSSTYYDGQEKLLSTAGHDYFLDYRSKLPKTVATSTTVMLATLVEQNYIEEIVDSNNEDCVTSKVVATKENDGTYTYTACLVCPDYVTSGTICQ